MKGIVLGTWDFFTGLGLSGLSLDLACGAVLGLLAMAAVPCFGRIMSVVAGYAMSFLRGMTGRHMAYLITNYLTFPGVVLHELSHAVGAKASGAKVTEIRFFEPDGERLGCVKFSCRGRHKRQMAVQMAVSSCAPVVLGWAFLNVFLSLSSWARGCFLLQAMSWHGAFSMLCHMDMSRQDMKNYIKGCLWLFPYAVAACTVIAYIIGHGAR